MLTNVNIREMEPMDLIITNWALDSYQLLINDKHVFSKDEFLTVIRPDVLLLKDGFPSQHEKFNQSKFWGEATLNGKIIQNAFKMKWHNIGDGKIQLRLCVIILKSNIYICNGYVKNDRTEPREMAKLKLKIDKINEGKFVKLGVI
jgi:hypothetical protein